MTLFLFFNPLYRFNTLIFQIFRRGTFLLKGFSFDLDKLSIYILILHFFGIHLLSFLNDMRIHRYFCMLPLYINLSQFPIIEDDDLFEHVEEGKGQENTKEILLN